MVAQNRPPAQWHRRLSRSGRRVASRRNGQYRRPFAEGGLSGCPALTPVIQHKVHEDGWVVRTCYVFQGELMMRNALATILLALATIAPAGATGLEKLTHDTQRM